MATETNYDAPRVRDDTEAPEDYFQQFTRFRSSRASGNVDVVNVNDVEPSVVDPERLYSSESTMPVVAQRADEFTCSRCFLVYHRSRHAGIVRDKPVCRDCS